MDQERDQFRARQERRAEMRQKQLQEQKRLRRNLIVAGVVALLCVAGIILLGRNAGGKDPAPQMENTPAQTEAVEQTAPVEETEEVSNRRNAPTTIHIRAAGDLNVTKSVVESGLVASGYDFSRAFLM